MFLCDFLFLMVFFYRDKRLSVVKTFGLPDTLYMYNLDALPQ